MNFVEYYCVLCAGVCQLYSEQRAIRVKRVVDRKRMLISVCITLTDDAANAAVAVLPHLSQ